MLCNYSMMGQFGWSQIKDSRRSKLSCRIIRNWHQITKELTNQLSNSIKLEYSNSNMIWYEKKSCHSFRKYQEGTPQKTNRQGWMDHSILSEAHCWASSRVGLRILCLSIAELLQTTFGASQIENHKLQGYNTKICFYGESLRREHPCSKFLQIQTTGLNLVHHLEPPWYS